MWTWLTLGQLDADAGGLLPHAFCLAADQGLLAVHAAADAAIALAYYSIPFALGTFAWRRRDLRFRWVFFLFGLFILACGTTHLLGVWTLWFPDYRVEAAVKMVTAVSSLGTALALWVLLPEALALPSPKQLEAAKVALEIEVQERMAAEEQVRHANAALEHRVAERTAELAAALAATEKAGAAAERAVEAKARFLAAASHDLRQPMQALRLFLDLLTQRLAGSEHEAVIGKAIEALQGSESLLHALLDISTLQAGIIRPQVVDFPVQEALDRLRGEALDQAAAKGLVLRMVPCAGVVRSDPLLLQRVLRNLVINAVRYTNTGRIVVGCRRRGGDLRIEVWDSGIGIPADKLEAVFEDFYQIDNPARDREKGLGLGLSVVDRTARLLGHAVELRSRPGRGTMFAITVPLSQGRRIAAA